MNFKNREEYIKSRISFGKDKCPFCLDLDKNNIIFETRYWFVIKNKYPYFNDNNGLIVFPKRHIEFSVDLTKEELTNFIEIERFMQDYYKNLGEYFSFIRQSKSNKSVEHMHYHYILGIPHARIINGNNYLLIENGYKK